jgi:basic membrane protein A and related proteins
MNRLKTHRVSLFAILLMAILTSCSNPTPTQTPQPKLKVGVVTDTGNVNDKQFNQYTVAGAQQAAQEAGLEFTYLVPDSMNDYEAKIDKLASGGANLIVTVGFRMGVATTKAARSYPNIKFVILDTAFSPGTGCASTVTDCYSAEGGLTNVTSLLFEEDQPGYLAGTLAACMSKKGIIAAVLGAEIPPVVRYAVGYENGAKAINPNIQVLSRYIPDFDDPETGQITAQDFIGKGADVLFAAAGNTGNGAMKATNEANVMTIGVDVDTYFTYPEVASVLLTSAVKNIQGATGLAVKDFAAGKLTAGIRLSNLDNDGVGLAPYHDWDSKIPQACKDKVEAAKKSLLADPKLTGAN